MVASYVSPISQLVHCTTRIICSTELGEGSGTGYFFNFCEKDGQQVPCIVTNKHVFKDAEMGSFCLTAKTLDGNPDLGNHHNFHFNDFENRWIQHPDPNIDLAIFPIGPLLNQAASENKLFYFTPLGMGVIASNELLGTLTNMEEIIMLGYPTGIWDSKHNLPIIRKGITATHPRLHYNGLPEFLIDAACFPGSSGSPVFLANIGSFVDASGALCAGSRIALLGTLYAGPQFNAAGEIIVVEVPTSTKSIAISRIPTNLGCVIHGAKLRDFEPLLLDILSKQTTAGQKT